jgi:hypothetical protein
MKHRSTINILLTSSLLTSEMYFLSIKLYYWLVEMQISSSAKYSYQSDWITELIPLKHYLCDNIIFNSPTFRKCYFHISRPFEWFSNMYHPYPQNWYSHVRVWVVNAQPVWRPRQQDLKYTIHVLLLLLL